MAETCTGTVNILILILQDREEGEEGREGSLDIRKKKQRKEKGLAVRYV